MWAHLSDGFVWSLAEKTRAGTGVLIVATLVIPVLIVRLQQTWDGTHGT